MTLLAPFCCVMIDAVTPVTELPWTEMSLNSACSTKMSYWVWTRRPRKYFDLKYDKNPAFWIWLKHLNREKLNWEKKLLIRNQSYQILVLLMFWFLLLSLSVCSIRKKYVYYVMGKLNCKKLINYALMCKKVW